MLSPSLIITIICIATFNLFHIPVPLSCPYLNKVTGFRLNEKFLTFLPRPIVGRDSSFNLENRYGAGRSEDRIPVGARFSATSRPVLGPTQPPIRVQWVPVISPG